MTENLKKFHPDRSWNLFLDRDGVINTHLVDEYVTKPSDFEFIEGAPESIAEISKIFNRIVVVSNQQGIGKGLMSEDDLGKIHDKMLLGLKEKGGRIDKIYFCPDLKESKSFYRKPSIGMALLAKKDFPDIEFRRSVMVGDSVSDMLFGKRLKMTTVFIHNDIQLIRENYRIIDYSFGSLKEFSAYLPGL
jgi:histidinol-phosphate phosphatase family protein